MKSWTTYLFIWMFLTVSLSEVVFSQITQSDRNNALHRTKGLRLTKDVLAALNLPDWYWGGAHVYINVEQNYWRIESNLLNHYLGDSATQGLYDPYELLDDKQRNKIAELITAHDMRSVLPLHVCILDLKQKLFIPNQEITTALSQYFADRSALVVFYNYGYSRGARGYIIIDGEVIKDDWEVRDLFIKSAQDASIQSDASIELESYIRELSKRSYWIEQRLIPPVMAKSDKEKNDANSQNKVIQWDKWLSIFNAHSLKLIGVFLILISGACYYLWSRRWRKYTLPSRDTAERFGAIYGANVSDSIDFSDPQNSISDQYIKIKSKDL